MAAPKNRIRRGVSIVENILAMAVLLVGAAGIAATQRQGSFFLGDARKMTRAATVAGDLAAQIQLWPFTDPRLQDLNLGNNGDLGDVARQFERLAVPPSDHAEANLTFGGTTWTGLGVDILDRNGMERFWNVSYDNVDSNGNGVPDAVRIAVIVRWRQGGVWRRIVVPTVKVNPLERM
jgi:hypothetical protein